MRIPVLSLLLLAVPVFAPAAAPSSPPSAPPPAQRFDPNQVDELARRLAAVPPRAPGSVTPGLEQLNYVQYRDIRARIDQVWAKDATPFRIDVLPAGFVYTAPVAVSVVENGVVRPLGSTPDSFDVGELVPAPLHGKALSLSGFRVRTRLNLPTKWDECLVFQGASYFRAVAKGQWYGLSARGLALRTAEPEGEEFPSFTQFWIEKPAPQSKSLVIHALLESASVTGGYHFTVTPGRDMVMDVKYTLFPRTDLKSVGIAPLTSMFLFDSTNRNRFDDFRPRVHDSDGLTFITRAGEQVWRPLANPRNLQVSAFTAEQPRAFGLMQRANQTADFQDFEAHYEKRPSAWVEFGPDSVPGPLRLVEIPTTNETNDNIVAFWQPRDVLPAGKPYGGAYRLHFMAESDVKRAPLGRIVATRVGKTFDGFGKQFVLDITGAGTSTRGLRFEVTTSAGAVLHAVLQPNPLINGLRATFEFDPGNAGLAEMHAVLLRASQPASETWLYRWTN